MVIDENDKIFYSNKATFSIFGFDKDKSLGINIQDNQITIEKIKLNLRLDDSDLLPNTFFKNDLPLSIKITDFMKKIVKIVNKNKRQFITAEMTL